MIKRIVKNSLSFGFIVLIITLLLESIISLKFSFKFSLAFIIGLFTGLFNLFLSNKSLERLEYNEVTRPKFFYSFIHILKFIIYGVVLYISTYFLGLYTSFLCAFGMLFNKIIIYYLNLVKIPKEDKLRSVDKLDLPKEIKEKLKYNDYFKVIDITLVNREKLLTFLTNKEVDLVIKSLKKYELFIKGELEAIIDNDENVDV